MKSGAENQAMTYEGGPESLVSFERRRLAESFGATPLIRTPYQEEVFQRLLTRIVDNRPGWLSDKLYDYIRHHFEVRFAKRQSRNSESHSLRLEQDDSVFDAEQLGLIELARQGFAYPEELLQVREMLGMGDIELGRVTHPYGDHLQDLFQLRKLTTDAINAMGGEVFGFDELEKYEIEGSDRSFKGQAAIGLDGLLVVRTRIVGLLPDGTEIHERSSFILDVNKCEGDWTIFQMWAHITPDESHIDEQLKGVMDIRRVAKPLVDNDLYDLAIPLSTTVFAVNPATKNIIHSVVDGENQRAMDQYPPISDEFLELLRLAREDAGELIDHY